MRTPAEQSAHEDEFAREVDAIIAHHVEKHTAGLKDLEKIVDVALDELARRNAWDAAYLTATTIGEQRAMQWVATMPHKPWPPHSARRDPSAEDQEAERWRRAAALKYPNADKR